MHLRLNDLLNRSSAADRAAIDESSLSFSLSLYLSLAVSLFLSVFFCVGGIGGRNQSLASLMYGSMSPIAADLINQTNESQNNESQEADGEAHREASSRAQTEAQRDTGSIKLAGHLFMLTT